jgi:hypothetical protein
VAGLSISSLIFVVGFVYGSFFEYAIHRWLMHGPPSFVRRDHMVHHREHFALTGADRHYVLLGWWAAPAILFGHSLVFWAIDVLSGLSVILPCLMALGAYYVLYEYIHWCMHNPADRAVERTLVFRYLNKNHQLHHLRPHINFNVVLPLGDLLFTTLRRTIRTHYSQDAVLIPPSTVRS